MGLSGQTVSMPPLGHQISPKLKALAANPSGHVSTVSTFKPSALTSDKPLYFGLVI